MHVVVRLSVCTVPLPLGGGDVQSTYLGWKTGWGSNSPVHSELADVEAGGRGFGANSENSALVAWAIQLKVIVSANICNQFKLSEEQRRLSKA